MTQSKASEKIVLRISVFSSRDLLLRLFRHGMIKNSRFKVSRNDFYPAQVVTCFTKNPVCSKGNYLGDSPFQESGRVTSVKILKFDWMKISDPLRRAE